MSDENLVSSLVKQIEQLIKEKSDLENMIEFYKKDSEVVRNLYIKPLLEYAQQGTTKVMPLGVSIIQETIRRAMAFDTIKSLLK